MIQQLESILSLLVLPSLSLFSSSSNNQFIPSLPLPLLVTATEGEKVLVPRKRVEHTPSKKALLVFSVIKCILHAHYLLLSYLRLIVLNIRNPILLPPLIFSLLSTRVNALLLLILSLDLFSIINLTYYYTSLPFLFLQFLYSGLFRKQCQFLPGKRL